MLDFPNWKKYLSIIVIIAAFVVVFLDFSNKSSNETSKGIKLGLDLQGGSYLVLEADREAFINEYNSLIFENIRTTLINEKISYLNLSQSNDLITFSLRDINDYRLFRNTILRGNEFLDIDRSNNLVTITITERSYNQQLAAIIENSIEIVRRRIDYTGTNEPNIKRQGTHQIVVELPGIDNPERIKRILGTTARLTFHLVDYDATFLGSTTKGGYKTVPSDDGYRYAIKIKPEIYGRHLVNAKLEFQDNQPIVFFAFDNEGGKQFARLTQSNINNLLAIVIDNKVISAPRINQAITGGSGIITGNFTIEEAQDLALLLKAGSLPIPLSVVEERTVGPTLGSDSINSGLIAGVIGYFLIFIFMFIVYKQLGLIANLVLIINTIFLLSVLSLLGATLTLPGIAGIILTTGMAVDANILVYERFSQELKSSKSSVILTLANSFKRVFLTIFDSNITTLFTAIFLFGFGSGPIKGFAVTLIIGILCSMFSIMFISKFLISIFLSNNKYKKARK